MTSNQSWVGRPLVQEQPTVEPEHLPLPVDFDLLEVLRLVVLAQCGQLSLGLCCLIPLQRDLIDLVLHALIQHS